MYSNDLEFHGQFERDFFNFLQRRKREQEEELQTILDRRKLKDTITQIEQCFESSLNDISKNEDTLSEISHLSDIKSVSRILQSEVFEAELSNVLEKPVKHYRMCLVCSDFHTGDEHSSDTADHSYCVPGTEGHFVTHLSSLVAGLPTGNLRFTENQPAKSIHKWPWVDTYDEVEDLARNEIVSKLNHNFEHHLSDVISSSTQRRMNTEVHREKGLSDRELGSCYISIGAAEIERNNLDKSHAAYTEALRIGIEQDDIVLQCKALAGMGTLADIRDDVETATKNYKTALDLLYHQLSTVEVTQLQDVIEDKLNLSLRTETF